MSTDTTQTGWLPIHKRQRIVDKSFRYRLIGTLLAFWAANALFFVLLQHFLYRGHLKAFYALVPRDGMRPLMSFDGLLNVSILFAAVFGATVLTFIGAYLSNQIAGPLHRARGALERVAQGDWSVDLRFRETDFLKDYPTVFNELVSSLRRGAEQDLQDLELLSAAAGDRDDVRAGIDRFRARIEARLGREESSADGSGVAEATPLTTA